MKCQSKISPRAQILPVQKSHGRRLKLDLSGENGGLAGRSELSNSYRLAQSALCAIADEREDYTLIYAVDDERPILDLYTMLLEPRGYLVRIFDNRINALAEL